MDTQFQSHGSAQRRKSTVNTGNRFKNGINQGNRINGKVLSVLFVAFLTAGYAQAQLSLGVGAGLYHSQFIDKYDGKKNDANSYSPGFQLGAVVEYSIIDNLSIQSGLLFAQQRNGYKGWYDRDNNESLKININFLQVPVNLRYNLNLNGSNVFLQAGPHIGFGLGGKYGYDLTLDGKNEKRKHDVKFGKIPKEPYEDEYYLNCKPLDFGLGLGLGLQSGNMQIALNHNIGLANLSYGTDAKAKTKINGLSVTATYFFGKKTAQPRKPKPEEPELEEQYPAEITEQIVEAPPESITPEPVEIPEQPSRQVMERIDDDLPKPEIKYDKLFAEGSKVYPYDESKIVINPRGKSVYWGSNSDRFRKYKVRKLMENNKYALLLYDRSIPKNELGNMLTGLGILGSIPWMLGTPVLGIGLYSKANAKIDIREAVNMYNNPPDTTDGMLISKGRKVYPYNESNAIVWYNENIYLYNKSDIMSKYEIRELMANNTDALLVYNKGISENRWGNFLAVGGLCAATVGMVAMDHFGEDLRYPEMAKPSGGTLGFCSLLVGSSMFLTGTIFNMTSRMTVRKSVYTYNSMNAGYSSEFMLDYSRNRWGNILTISGAFFAIIGGCSMFYADETLRSDFDWSSYDTDRRRSRVTTAPQYDSFLYGGLVSFSVGCAMFVTGLVLKTVSIHPAKNYANPYNSLKPASNIDFKFDFTGNGVRLAMVF